MKTKRKLIQPLTEERSHEELTLAAEVSLRASGKRNAAGIIKEITQTTPSRAKKYKRALDRLHLHQYHTPKKRL